MVDIVIQEHCKMKGCRPEAATVIVAIIEAQVSMQEMADKLLVSKLKATIVTNQADT